MGMSLVFGTLLFLVAKMAATPVPVNMSVPGTLARYTGGLDLHILHTNDMHARFEQTNRWSARCTGLEEEHNDCYGGFARVSSEIKRARAEAASGKTPPVLVLNGGDTFQGSIYYTFFKWSMAAAFTNMLSFDAMSLGNHEFDDGTQNLVPFLKNVTSPILACNVDASNVTGMNSLLKKSTVVNVAGREVGIIGYITPETEFLSNTGQTRFLDEIETLTAEAKELNKKGVKIIIVIGHSGYKMDQKIAAEVPFVDVVVGGHSHTFLYTGTKPDDEVPQGPYPTFVTQKSGRVVPVVQAYAFTKYLGSIKVSFNGEGEIVSPNDVQGAPILLNKDIPEDPDVLTELKKWKTQLTEKTEQPVGKTLTVLEFKTCRYLECNIGNAISDAYVINYASSYKGEGWTDTPIGISNSGNIRTGIDATSENGTVRYRDVLEVLPFDNYVMRVTLKGKVLLEMLEHGVHRYDPSHKENRGEFLQFSGLRVVFDVTAKPGKRVVSAEARCGSCRTPSYSPVVPNSTYNVILNNFMLSGGDGFTMLANNEGVVNLGHTISESLVNYFNNSSPVFAEIDGRILFGPSSRSAAYSPRLLVFLIPLQAILFACLRTY